MSRKIWFVLVGAVLAWPLCLQAATEVPNERSGVNTWIERPWEFRYFMQVKQIRRWHFVQTLAAKTNAKEKRISLAWQIFFDSSHIVRMPDWGTTDPKHSYDQAVVVIEFDKYGLVTSPHRHQGSLRGRLNEIRRLVMSEGDASNDKVYALAEWFTGRDEDTPIEVTPALCYSSSEMPGPFSAEDRSYIYGNLFKPEPGDRLGFGCREWAYQLYSVDRPYIDVTTYGPKSKRFPHGTYINDFIGWSTFDAKKPVIGRHAATWYCLHECPSGDAPGKIDNIKIWATRNGWKPPKPPTRVPTFTDDPQRRGTYVD